jgi:hypothetical protein
MTQLRKAILTGCLLRSVVKCSAREDYVQPAEVVCSKPYPRDLAHRGPPPPEQERGRERVDLAARRGRREITSIGW